MTDGTAWPADLRRRGLFSLLRRAEAAAPDKPRIGMARRPEQSIVDLAQEPSLGFAARTLEKVEQRHGRPRLYGHWLGLLGPMGPLPTHLSEFAFYERRYADKQPFGDWLALISGRMLQLFYRAWAESQPAAQADRPAEDRFAQWLGALSGGMEAARADEGFRAHARLHYASLFAGLRSASALEDGLSHLLRQPAQVREYMPRWRQLEPGDQTTLGRGFATLGEDAVLGRRIYSASDAFRVVVRASDHGDYLSLLPGGHRFAVAAEAIEAFKPSHLEWDLCIELLDSEAPAARLDGRSRLGWSVWLKPAQRPRAKQRRPRRLGTAMGPSSYSGTDDGQGPIRADVHLRSSSRKRKSAP